MRRLLAVPLLCVLLCGACARKIPPPAAPPPGPTADPAAIFTAVQHQEEKIHTLRARFSAEFVSNAVVRRASGVLLVKKPDRFRLRLLSPFGLTVFDYNSRGEHARIELPLEGKQLTDGEIDHSAPFPPALLRQQFLRIDAEPAERCAAEAQDAEVIVTCRDAAGAMQREIAIDRRTARVSREFTVLVDGRNALTLYEDYRPVGDVELPFEIRLVSESHVLHVAVTGYEVNPILPDTLFDPPEKVDAGP